MSNLSNLPENAALEIIALPYKAAMMVSHADDVEGEDDDFSEMRAIERGIPAIAALHDDSVLVTELAPEIIRLKDRWAQWEDECFFCTKQAPDIMALVVQQFGESEAREYRAFILELGKMVAQAHGEFESFDDEPSKKEGFMSGLITKIVGGMSNSNNSEGHAGNISPAENDVLSQISAALEIN